MKLSRVNELVDLMPMIKNQVVVGRFGIQHPDCEDLENDIFIRCMKSLWQFDSTYPLKPWVYKIANWVSLDFLRRRKDIVFYKIVDIPTRDCTVFEKFLLFEVSEAVFSDGCLLTNKQKIVTKWLLQDYNNIEIARELNVTHPVVFQMKKRIFKKVRERFESIEINNTINEH